MPQTGKPPVEQSCQESSTESNDQPDDQPEAQHGAQPEAQSDAQPEAQPNEYRQTQSGLQMLLREKAPSKTPPRPDEFVGEGDTDRLPNQQYAEESTTQPGTQPEAQSGTQPEGQSDAQPEEQSNEDSIFDVSTLHEVLPLRLLGS